MISPEKISQAGALFAEAHTLLAATPGLPERVRQPVARARDLNPLMLVSGLCSVGKSSFVSALWGDAALLPTAVRDCTQTNTLIRTPATEESDRRLLLSFLTREKAIEFAARGLAFYRLAEFITEQNGPLGPRLDELPAEQRLRETVKTVRRIFSERPALFVLHENLMDAIDELEQFLEFLDTSDFQPQRTVEKTWAERREYVMGRRRPDGRTLDVGKLLSLEHVEIVRRTPLWPEGTAPRIIDSPWIPAFHEARRVDLILEQAGRADILIVLALPQAFTFEEWIIRLLRDRPELLKRIVVVFNQADTIDAAALFSRDGFASTFQRNAEYLTKLGIDPANIFITCARLPYLELELASPERPAAEAEQISTRVGKLKKTLAQLQQLAGSRPPSDFTRRLTDACNPAGAGIESLRRRLNDLSAGTVLQSKLKAALDALKSLSDFDFPETSRDAWKALKPRIHALES
jgi:hypothetical protein